MADIFRKKSLDKLSSPEQLDRMIIINSPMTWVALAGGAFLIASVLLWGIFGRVPMTEEGNGILLREGKVNSVYAKTQGVVTKVNVSSGDMVEAGDALYEVSSQETALLAQGIQERIQKVEAVSYDSENDVITSDNQALVNIKNQKLALPLEEAPYEMRLNGLNDAYAKKQAEVSAFKQELDRAEQAYYDTLSEESGSSVQYEFDRTASEYQAAENAFQELDAAYQNACNTANACKAAWEAAKALLKEAKESGGPETVKEAKREIKTAKSAYDSAKTERDSYKEERGKAEKERAKKEAAYQSKKAAYEEYIQNSGQASAQKTQRSNEYNLALSNYNTAKAELKSLETEIGSVKAQLNAGEESKKVQEDSLKNQFDAAKEAVLDELNRELENCRMLMEGMEIKSEVSGIVYSTFVTNGSMVTVDMEVARISEPKEAGKLQAVYFMQLEKGKKVEKGMRAYIYPSTLSKEEYGHMSGTVAKVADYVTSHADLYTRVGDSTLAETFSGSGAVVEVVCEIEEDESTASGYAWSSKKGAGIELQEGTLLAGTVVTENVPPITMLIPKLKETFHLE